MPNPGLIDEYLDELLDALRVDGRRARRILIETEDHLAEAVRDRVAAGSTPAEAERSAIERFGPARELALRFNNGAESALSQKAWFLRLYLYAALLGGIGLIAVGIAGQISAGVGVAFGKDTVAGDQGGVTYTPARCAEYFEYAPGAANCEAAATDHHFDELWRNTTAALILGVLVVGSHLWLRRRYAATDEGAALPRRAFAIVGAVAFGTAGLGLAAVGGLGTILNAHAGNAAFLVDGLVALAFFAAFAPSGWRNLRAMSAEGSSQYAMPIVAE
jgi:hypothetical protein